MSALGLAARGFAGAGLVTCGPSGVPGMTVSHPDYGTVLDRQMGLSPIFGWFFVRLVVLSVVLSFCPFCICVFL